MTNTQIRCFLEVAKEESFTKAAEKLFISHQGLSNHIKALEKELGLRLLDRSNKRHVVLTDSGKVMFDAWTEVWKIMEEAEKHARKLQKSGERSLVIGIQDMRFVRSYVVPMIRKLQEEADGLNLEYRLGTPVEMFRMLEDGSVDMLIMISSDINPKTKYKTRLLTQEALHLVYAVSKNHPLAKQKTISFKDLTDETVLMIDDSYSGEAAKRFQKDLELVGMRPARIKSFNGPRAINIAVETGLGVAILFDELLEEARDEIKTFPAELQNAQNTDMLLVWKRPELDQSAERIAELF